MRPVESRWFLAFRLWVFWGVWIGVNAGAIYDASASPQDSAEHSEHEFRQKLSQMLQRTEKSIKVLSSQITESLSAPFLPDLYLQLAELQSQRSNTLYYIQMEIQKGSSDSKSDKEFSPVVAAQKESISTYKMILSDFPKFQKRANVMYRLGLALKSIDETADFVRFASQVLREFPLGEEAMRCKILLGQHYFENHDYSEALKLLLDVTYSSFVYERNLARYKVGLIKLETDHFKEALDFFEKVALDSELTEQDNPYEVSVKQRSTKSDLKREALIDSIRAYTHVYEKDPNPIQYYSKVAPTEILFQEVIEKLTLRYVQQKRYEVAIRLLRTLGERTVDPEKTINIYRDVLVMMPPNQRVVIPANELKYVLEKYNQWSSYYQIPPNLRNSTYTFFEKQTRELGTTSHDLAKRTSQIIPKTLYLKRARDFYQVYLGFFSKTAEASKIATNLADVYFSLNDFLKCGDFYLRTFQSEFGKSNQSRALIENAILCLEKKSNLPFYENLRVHGLLIKSIQSYIAFDHSKSRDPNLNFLLVKTEYEQGFFPEALDKIYAFIRQYPRSPRAIDAADLILDYYNTRNDYVELQRAAGRLQGMQLNNPKFSAKLVLIKKAAYGKAIQEKVKTSAGYDDFAQGKSYLAAALGSGDAQLQNQVLKEALGKSRRERDIDTFLKIASVMASKEPDPNKKSEILNSIAHEQLRITQFYTGLASLKKVYEGSSFNSSVRQGAFDDAIGVMLVLRDFDAILGVRGSPLWRTRGAAVKQRFRDQTIDLLDSPVRISSELVRLFWSEGTSEEALLSLFKARSKVDSGIRQAVSREASQRCSGESRQPICLWTRFEQFDRTERPAFLRGLAAVQPGLPGVQAQAEKFAGLSTRLKSFEGSGDVHLEIASSIRGAEIYQALGHFLELASQKNPDLKAVLDQKAQETRADATAYLNKCKTIAQKSPVVTPATQYCAGRGSPSFDQFLEVKWMNPHSSSRTDRTSVKISDLQKTLFGSQEDGGSTMLSLAKIYLDDGDLARAAATATYGISSFRAMEAEFHSVVGCSVMKMGFLSEASFHLNAAPEDDPLKLRCSAQLAELKGRI